MDVDFGFVNSGFGVNGMAHNAGPAPSPLGQMPPNEMPGAPMPGFFPPFMGGPRYSGGPRGPNVRMPQMGGEFNGPPGQPMMPNAIDPSRQGEGGEYVGWQGPPPMGPMNPRMNPPRGVGGMGPMGPGSYGPGSMRGPPPNNNLGPGPGGPGSTPGMSPMSMAGPSAGRPGGWQPTTSTPMNYSSSSPGNYGGPPGSAGPPGPGTPIMPSPQGGDNMYTLMKPVAGGNIGNDFPMGSGPDAGPLGPMAPNSMGPVMNGDGLDGMKNSPANGGPGTPREDNSSGMPEYNLGGFGGPAENVSISQNSSYNPFLSAVRVKSGKRKENNRASYSRFSSVLSISSIKEEFESLNNFDNAGSINETVGFDRSDNHSYSNHGIIVPKIEPEDDVSSTQY